MLLPPPISTLFPYTTLFRSRTVYASAESARQASRARDREGGLGHAAQDHAVAPAREADAEGVRRSRASARGAAAGADRKSTRLNSSHRCISYAVFCLKKKKN